MLVLLGNRTEEFGEKPSCSNGPFLESPSNLTGPKPYFKIKIQRIKKQALASKPASGPQSDRGGQEGGGGVGGSGLVRVSHGEVPYPQVKLLPPGIYKF